MNTKYMYKNRWTDEYSEIFSKDFETRKYPYLRIVKNGIILPTLENKDLAWGKGWVLDESGKFIKESMVGEGIFGGRMSMRLRILN